MTNPPFSWQTQFRIASEIATGLHFLHQTKPTPIVHRDLKPRNIVNKIADVGLSRLVPPSKADSIIQYQMTLAVGTFCYIDPEYQKTGILGTKSDIHALGIILLQMMTGTVPIGLAHNMDEAMETESLEKMLHPKVTDWPIKGTQILAKLGLKCAELRQSDIPVSATVVLPELNRLRDFAELRK